MGLFVDIHCVWVLDLSFEGVVEPKASYSTQGKWSILAILVQILVSNIILETLLVANNWVLNP